MITHLDIIGLGGTGSAIAEPLIRLLKYHPQVDTDKLVITICDADRINDSSNQERQAYFETQAGSRKVTVLKNRLVQLFPTIKSMFTYVNFDIYSDILEKREEDSVTLLIATVDNNRTRNHLLRAMLDRIDRNVIYMSPGNDITDGQVISFGVYKGETLGYNPLEFFPDLQKPKDYIPRIRGCVEEAESSPQLISTNQLAATLTLINVQNLLDSNSFYQQIFFDIRKGKVLSDELVKVPIIKKLNSP